MVGKIVLVFLAFGATAIRGGLTPEQKETLFGIHKECSKTTGVTDEQYEAHMNGQFSNDPQSKEHALCFAKTLNMMTEDGKLKLDVIKAQLVPMVGDSKAAEMMDKCAKEMGTPQETAFEVSKCMYEEQEHH